ncbi:phosphate ABC transporter substrate-binding protein [Streptomyces sp. WMMC500]|uniref:phosphate ABC transporter substrate-binding protein n=1 Tax=Streptomyces sp. WMMC500 TaxID=3015154 RepID=UPI00248ACA75|nr:phosphate ABC transporter substrate-binding protein [Streptomyces sp. WMMC500]WBB59702.1 phosphate ABC transporter substrate-binding protein [Streptomyces sp. WMMC500]
MFTHTRRAACLASTAVLFMSVAGCADDSAGAGGALQVSGSTTVAPVAADAAEALKAKGLDIVVATQGGSAGGISQLAAGQIGIAMSSKPIAVEDESAHPDTDFRPTQVGADAVGVIVTREVAEGGVKNLTKAQVRDLFEGRIANWSELGGPDLEVFVYNKEPGRGTREELDRYVYGEEEAPPPPDSGNYATVGGDLETRDKLKSTPGAVAPLSTGIVEGHDDLAVVTLDGVAPSPENVATGEYPMDRPLYLITDGEPEGTEKKFIDYVLSPEGQELMTKHRYLTLEELKK